MVLKQSLIIPSFLLVLFLIICYVFVQKPQTKTNCKQVCKFTFGSSVLVRSYCHKNHEGFSVAIFAQVSSKFHFVSFPCQVKRNFLEQKSSLVKNIADTHRKTHPECFALNKFYLYFLSAYWSLCVYVNFP